MTTILALAIAVSCVPDLGALDAARAVNDNSVRTDREYVGVILQLADGTCVATVDAGRPGAGTASAHVKIPPGAQAIALWHTHGAPGPDRHLFSDDDIETADRTGLTFYMMDATGTLRAMDPIEPRDPERRQPTLPPRARRARRRVTRRKDREGRVVFPPPEDLVAGD